MQALAIRQFERTNPGRKVALRNMGGTWDLTSERVGDFSRISRNFRSQGIWYLTDDWVRVSDLDGRRDYVFVFLRRVIS